MANRLANETSPYLLQHKDNPVDWYPWGEEALALAEEQDKPILVSIGYSACHWCHVMEHESFENPEIAALMNDLFVNIKVDREERPDIDSLYMSAVQAMSGHGGWPLNVWLTPDGSPFFGGTYFPPEDKGGMPGLPKVLQAVASAYRERRDEVEQNAETLRDFLHQATTAPLKPGELDPDVLDQAAESLATIFDERNGGFGGAPKFPQPAALEFLLRYWKRTKDRQSETIVRTTLDKMALGGINDQLGGGFHRYTVDENWLVPHFEKMLYDNAQLARLYLDGYRAFHTPLYRRVAEETLEYVVREMTSPEGGFYTAQDADSEGEEGKFYVWSLDELRSVLGEDEAGVVARYFDVSEGGNFEGANSLSVPQAAAVAAQLNLSPEDLRARVDAARPKLLAARDQRVRPGRDDKVITSWNGLMMRAFAEGSRVLNRPDFAEVAERNADFILTHLRQEDGRLLRTYKDGRARLNAFLEDYAFVIDGLLALYQATLNRRWIEAAIALAAVMVDDFADEDGQSFHDTSKHHERLVARPRDLQDGATPAGNSVAAEVLFKLAAMTGDEDYTRRPVKLLSGLSRAMGEQAIAFGRFLTALDFYLAVPKEVVVAGDLSDPALQALVDAVYQNYEPNVLIGHADPDDTSLIEVLPFLADRTPRGGKSAAYLCERHACMPPVTEPAALLEQLEFGTGVMWQEL